MINVTTKSNVHGAISIVNALATGKGSALGISLETTAEVLLTSESNVEVIINNDKSEDTNLARECFKLIQDHSSESCGAKISVNSDIQLIVYDLRGSRIKTLVRSFHTVGNYSTKWDASFYPSGVYLLSMESGAPSASSLDRLTQKVVLIK